MKKATCTTFVNILNTIHAVGITTKEALMANQVLYTEFWLALMDFCHFATLSKTGGKSKTGKILSGNLDKVETLEKDPATERSDIEIDCAVFIIEKLNDILSQPLEKQKNYVYNTINHYLFDRVEAMSKTTTISLDAPIRSNTNEDDAVLGDIIRDNRHNPELHCLVKDTILYEISCLSTRVPEVLVRMGCKFLDIKTKDLAARIIHDGYENTFAQIIFDVAAEYDIELKDIRNIITESKLTEKSYKKDKGLVRLLSGNAKVVADQISKYANRAKDRLHY